MNTKKRKIMRILTRKKSPLNLVGKCYIEGQPLKSVSVHKDLRLFTANDLSWQESTYIYIYI